MTAHTHDVHAMVDELIRPHTHRENYSVRRGTTTWALKHTTQAPALIDQLLEATPTGGDSTGSGGYKSRPAAHLEGLDTLLWIDLAASRWVRELGELDPVDRLDEATGFVVRGSGTKACISKLYGLLASAQRCDKPNGKGSCCTAHLIEGDVRRWWMQARIISGWDSAAWRPDNTCLHCGHRGGLRVRLFTHSALCIECRETWDEHTIPLLAEHIRTENRDEVA